MTTLADSERWSGSKMLGIIGTVLGIQCVLVFLFSERETSIKKAPKPAGLVRYLGAEQFHSVHLVRDASLMSRVHRRSATGSLWNSVMTPGREYIDWEEPPRFYEREGHRAGKALRRTVSALEVPVSITSPVEPELLPTDRPSLPLPNKTTLEVRGTIRSRLPDGLEALPRWSHTNVLKPTVLSVGLDRFGWAHTTLVLSNSLPIADAYALEWIRKTQFQAISSENSDATDLDWGEITFRWGTKPEPSETRSKP